jgi:hypothetical protein
LGGGVREVKRVFDASESVNRLPVTVSSHRLQKFNVYPIKDYNLFQVVLKDSKFGPVKPLDPKNVDAMATCRLTDNDFYLDYVLKKTPFPIQQHEKTPYPRSPERRILTVVYQKYFEVNKKKP